MFQKLVKYEWKSYAKPMLFLLISIFSITVLSSLCILFINMDMFTGNNSLATLFNTSTIIGIGLLYYFGLIACSLIATLLIAIRYYKTMYTDQGYLTHTLPVSRMELFWSKLVSSFGFQLYSLFLVSISIFIIVATILYRISTYEDMNYTFSMLLSEMISDFGLGNVIFWFAFFIIFSLVSCAVSVQMIYAAITYGQLFRKHRIIGAIVAYFIETIILQIITFILTIGFSCFCSINSLDFSSSLYYKLLYGSIFVIEIILAFILHFATKYQLLNNLNLE